MTQPTPRPVDALFPQAQRVEAITLGFCVLPPFGCGLPVTSFRDEISAREFRISGMCQECQDRIWS